MLSNIGIPGLVLILILALIIFGPKKLPELGKGLGEAIRGFKKALNEDDKQAIRESESSNHEQKRSDP